MTIGEKTGYKAMGVGCQLARNDTAICTDFCKKVDEGDAKSKVDRVVMNPYVTVGRGIGYAPVPSGNNVGWGTKKEVNKRQLGLGHGGMNKMDKL